MNTRSISFRLVTWYAGLLTGIFVLLCALLYLDLRHFLVNDLRQSQSRRTRQIANTLLVHVKQTGEATVARISPALTFAPSETTSRETGPETGLRTVVA